jgi:hypothetical protein
VGDPFGLLNLGPPGGEGAVVRLNGTGLPAARTGLFGRELVGLLLEEQFECALGEALSRDGGDLLHGSEVDIESRSVVAEGPPGDDFGPLSSQSAELEEFFGCESGGCHGLSCLAVASKTGWDFLSRPPNPARLQTNRELTSIP